MAVVGYILKAPRDQFLRAEIARLYNELHAREAELRQRISDHYWERQREAKAHASAQDAAAQG
jgi:hypothetical protein